jgi:dTDP-4-dehydrorhamnose reductase
MKIWILGSSGMVGTALLDICKNRGISVVGSSRAGCDICNRGALQSFAAKVQPTHLINCAAYTDVDGAESHEKEAFAVNAAGAENVACVARDVGARCIHISTDYVFGGGVIRPYCEEDVCSPINVYGESKLEGERRVLSRMPEALIVRTSWVFGASGKNFISSFLSRLCKETCIKAVSDQEGKPTYCYDLAEALLELCEVSGVVHFANGGGGSRYSIARELLDCARSLHLPVTCEQILPALSADFPTKAVRPHYSVLDTTKYTQLTGKEPRHWTSAFKEQLCAVCS